jgi:hypothetical protein
MSYETEDQILELVSDVQQGTLPRAQWTHAAHLTVALYFLWSSPSDEAIHTIRQGIQHYNRSQEIPSTSTGGYHETITLFWIKIVQYFLRSVAKPDSLRIAANQLIHRYGNPKLLFEHYSSDYLFSSLARSTWVEPNLKPLDRHP